MMVIIVHVDERLVSVEWLMKQQRMYLPLVYALEMMDFLLL